MNPLVNLVYPRIKSASGFDPSPRKQSEFRTGVPNDIGVFYHCLFLLSQLCRSSSLLSENTGLPHTTTMVRSSSMTAYWMEKSRQALRSNWYKFTNQQFRTFSHTHASATAEGQCRLRPLQYSVRITCGLWWWSTKAGTGSNSDGEPPT